MELSICRNPVVGKTQYSDLSSGYTIYVTPLKMYTVHVVYMIDFSSKIKHRTDYYIGIYQLHKWLDTRAKRREELNTLSAKPFVKSFKCVFNLKFFSLDRRFKICDTDLKIERKFKTLFRGFVSQLYRSNFLAFLRWPKR